MQVHGGPIVFKRCFLAAILIASLATSSAQPGANFVSVDCGGSSEFTSAEGIAWKPDSVTNFDHSPGLPARIVSNVSSIPRELQTLQYFPDSVSSVKSCYVIPVESPKSTYLFRAGFLYANYDQLNRPPSFLISLDYDYWAFVQLKAGNDPVYYEVITAISSDQLTFCLIRVDNSATPLLNTLELRPLPYPAYSAPSSGSAAYVGGAPMLDRYYISVLRVNFGGPFIRFPDDEYDRFWSDYRTVLPETGNLEVLSTFQSVNTTAATRDLPPERVMQTAVSGTSFSFSLTLTPQLLAGSMLLNKSKLADAFPSFYFTEIADVSEDQDRIVRFACSNLLEENLVDLKYPFLAHEAFSWNQFVAFDKNTTCTFTRAPTSTLDPLLNAIDFYTVRDKLLSGTSAVDVQALDEVKAHLSIQHLWFGDPCLPVPWDAVLCATDSTYTIRVTSLNISGMNLSGSIPSSILSMTSLTRLDISNNSISGSFPGWLGTQLPNLEYLDVSNNRIGGSFPESLVTKLGKNFRYSGNAGLCSSNGQGCNNSHTGRMLLGAIIGGACAVAIISIPVIYFAFFLAHSSKNGLFDKQYRQLQSRLKTSGARTRPFSLFRIRQITKGFKTKIGEGGFGPVFYGRLKDGQEVAVKVLSAKSRQGRQEFYNEIELLSVVHHKYLVCLLGYCQSWKQQILVYEYMKGGDLCSRLHGKMASANPLTWMERMSIILEVAEGLEYLHHGCSPAIIHRDVKSKNILLTERMTSKVADFGLSRLFTLEEEGATHVTTVVKGTTGYLDPEYYITEKLTEKSDVYGYGVLLMETITGRAVVDHSQPSEHVFVVDWVRSVWAADDLVQLADVNLAGDYDATTFSGLVNLSLWCVERSSVHRPPMTEVLKELRRLGLERALTSSSIKEQVNMDHDGFIYGSDSESLGTTTSMSFNSNTSSCPRPGTSGPDSGTHKNHGVAPNSDHSNILTSVTSSTTSPDPLQT